jgi:hypothetical protein
MEAVIVRNGVNGPRIESLFETDLPYLVGATPAPISISDNHPPNFAFDPEGIRMSRRPLVLALAFAMSPLAVHAEDLLQTYELARAGDPQYSAAESHAPRHPRRLGAGAFGAPAAIGRQRVVLEEPHRFVGPAGVSAPRGSTAAASTTPPRATTASTCRRWSTTTATSPGCAAPTR